MLEWLHWFDNRMHGKKVLLLLDNFPAHELAVQFLEDAKETGGGLQNTTVKWLPPNATSVHQPLDQGIIKNWKTYVCKQFVRFMVETFDAGQDPMAKMNVLRAVRWGINAWENEVMLGTIQNCWARSQAIEFGSQPVNSSVWSDSSEAMNSL
jgi:hypothetical protein